MFELFISLTHVEETSSCDPRPPVHPILYTTPFDKSQCPPIASPSTVESGLNVETLVSSVQPSVHMPINVILAQSSEGRKEGKPQGAIGMRKAPYLHVVHLTTCNYGAAN